MSDTPKPREGPSVVELLPEKWRDPNRQLLVHTFRMVGVPLAAVSPPIVLEIGDALLLAAWLDPPVLAVGAEYGAPTEGGVVVELSAPGPSARHPAGPHALFFASLPEWTSPAIAEGQQQILDAVSVMTLTGGLSMANSHVEGYRIEFPDGELASIGVMVDPGLWVYEPSVSEDNQRRWKAVADAISAHPDRARIELALRWLDDAKRSPYRDATRAANTDAFLKLWFAIETLAMPNTTDIRPIRDALATVYGVTAIEAVERFGIGRAYSLRSKIGHDGDRVSVSGHLQLYLEGVFVDLLAEHLGLSASKSAQRVLDEHGGVANLLPKIVGGRSEQYLSEYIASAIPSSAPTAQPASLSP